MRDFAAQNRQQGETMLHILNELRCHPRQLGRPGQYYAHCPFHEDDKPSLSLLISEGIFNCFGCDLKGTYWDFGLALKSRGYGSYPCSKRTRTDAQRIRRQVERIDARPMLDVDVMEVRRCHQRIVAYWHEYLLQNPQYLRLVNEQMRTSFERKIYQKGQDMRVETFTYESPRFDIQTIKKFQIGFAPPSGVELTTFLREKGIEQDIMIATGLLRKHGNSGLISLFAGHVIYPYLQNGRADYVIGRITEYAPGNLGDAKYHKQRVWAGKWQLPLGCPYVFNEDAMMDQSPTILMTEGITDAIKAVEAGVPAISLGTTALRTSSLDEICSRLSAKLVLVCFDAERNQAGALAAARTVRDLKARGVDTYKLTLPMLGDCEKTDVCSYILSEGVDAFHALIEEQSGVTFRSTPTKTTLNISAFILGKVRLDGLLLEEREHVILHHIFTPA